MAFTKATREKLHARIALLGPAGSGKTYDALMIAKGLGGKTALLDTEHRAASKYAGLFDFDTDYLTVFSPENYEAKIHEAEKAGYANLVIDSLSHAWAGKGGILEFVDNKARASGGNSFGVWRDATPKHNSLVETMLAANLNLIVTMRVKMDYAMEKDGSGRTVIRKVGLQPVQRDGLEYEFDIVADIDSDHNIIVTKSRCFELADYQKNKPGIEFGQAIAAWLNAGTAPVKPAPVKPAPKDLTELIDTYGGDDVLAVFDGAIPDNLTEQQIADAATLLWAALNG